MTSSSRVTTGDTLLTANYQKKHAFSSIKYPNKVLESVPKVLRCPSVRTDVRTDSSR